MFGTLSMQQQQEPFLPASTYPNRIVSLLMKHRVDGMMQQRIMHYHWIYVQQWRLIQHRTIKQHGLG